MSIEMCFRYLAEDDARFEASESVVYLRELFEVPDYLLKMRVFESFEIMEAKGLLPAFVLQYRKEVGSEMAYYLNTTEEEQAANSKAWLAESGDGLPYDNIFDSEPLNASDVGRWANLWIVILERCIERNPKLLRLYLPLGHEGVSYVLKDLRLVLAQANEASEKSVKLRLEAWFG